MGNPQLTVCDANTTARLLPFDKLVPALAQAARDVTAGAINAPARQVVPLGTGGVMLSMPATGTDIGVHKLVNVVAANRDLGLPTINGVVTTYDATTGMPRMVLDGPTVTNRRTAGISMLALKHLWPDGPHHVTIIGNGTQARAHAQALRDLYPQTLRIDIIGHTNAKSEVFCADHEELALQSADHVADTCDLVITTTTSATPVYDQPAQQGRHIIAVGAYRHDLAEIAPATLTGSLLFVDDPEGAHEEAGDYIQAGIDWNDVRALRDLMDLPSPDQPCVFKSVGCAAWDLAAGRCAMQSMSD